MTIPPVVGGHPGGPHSSPSGCLSIHGGRNPLSPFDFASRYQGPSGPYFRKLCTSRDCALTTPPGIALAGQAGCVKHGASRGALARAPCRAQPAAGRARRRQRCQAREWAGGTARARLWQLGSQLGTGGFPGQAAAWDRVCQRVGGQPHHRLPGGQHQLCGGGPRHPAPLRRQRLAGGPRAGERQAGAGEPAGGAGPRRPPHLAAARHAADAGGERAGRRARGARALPAVWRRPRRTRRVRGVQGRPRRHYPGLRRKAGAEPAAPGSAVAGGGEPGTLHPARGAGHAAVRGLHVRNAAAALLLQRVRGGGGGRGGRGRGGGVVPRRRRPRRARPPAAGSLAGGAGLARLGRGRGHPQERQL